MAKVLKRVKNNVPIKNIPFNRDPLTLIIKEALYGKDSAVKIFVNISPSKFDTAVTNRSLKFAMQTGSLKTKKAVDHVDL